MKIQRVNAASHKLMGGEENRASNSICFAGWPGTGKALIEDGEN